MTAAITRIHGGPDARGAARWDFSTCSNACGPCPSVRNAVQAADATRYPDPSGATVRAALAELHGVAPQRVLLAASASEFIQRITAVTQRLWPGAVSVPRQAYGDYAVAAQAWGRMLIAEDLPGAHATLRWQACPSSPLGQDALRDPHARQRPSVLDAVYAPLRLRGRSAWHAGVCDQAFVLHSPNKALGLTGLRGAYAIAPREADYDLAACCAALAQAQPSWPLSAHSEAMLRAWAQESTQRWVADARTTLAEWQQWLLDALHARGFVSLGSQAAHCVVQPPCAMDLDWLRTQEVAVRDATSFGLAGHWRVSAQPPMAIAALLQAWDRWQEEHR
jgi:histidinol-phosphate aminotransferase